jgi:septal ring-binding cell division protein DamX
MSNSNSSQFFLGRLAKAFSLSKKKTPPISPSTSDESITSSTHDVTYRDDDNADGTSVASVDSNTTQVRFNKLKNDSVSQDGTLTTDPDPTAPSASQGAPTNTSQSRTFQPNYTGRSRMDLDESALTSPWPPKGLRQHNQSHISDLRPADSVSQRPSYGPRPNETSLT